MTLSLKSALILVTATAFAVPGAMAQAPVAPPQDVPAPPVAPAVARGPVKPGAPTPGTLPQASGSALQFDKTQVDYGTIIEGERIEMQFPFRNVTDRTINITAINVSCGCTTAGNNPKSVAPGASEVIRVAYDSRGRVGRSTKTVTVNTDENPQGAQYFLSFSGDARQEVFATLPMVNFGEVAIGKESSVAFDVISLNDPPSAVTSVAAGDPMITSQTIAPEPYTHTDGRKGTKTRVVLTLSGKDQPRRVATTVNVATTNQKTPRVSLPVSGELTGEFTISPRRLMMGRFMPGEERTMRIALKGRGEKPFSVTVTPPADLPLKVVEVPTTAVGMKEFDVTFTAPTKQDAYNRFIDFTITTEGREELARLSFSATVRDVASTQQPAVPGAAAAAAHSAAGLKQLPTVSDTPGNAAMGPKKP